LILNICARCWCAAEPCRALLLITNRCVFVVVPSVLTPVLARNKTWVLSFGFLLVFSFVCQSLGLAGGTPEASVLTQITSLPGSNPRKARLIKQYSKPTVDYDDAPTVAEVSLPWRRGVNGGTLNSPFHSHKVVHSFCLYIYYFVEHPSFIFYKWKTTK